MTYHFSSFPQHWTIAGSLIIALSKSHSVTPNPCQTPGWTNALGGDNRTQWKPAAVNDAAAAAQLADDIAADKLGACGQDATNTPIQPTPPSGQQGAAVIDTKIASVAHMVFVWHTIRTSRQHWLHERRGEEGGVQKRLKDPHAPRSQQSLGEKDNKNHPSKPPLPKELRWGNDSKGIMAGYLRWVGYLKHLWMLDTQNEAKTCKGRSERVKPAPCHHHPSPPFGH